MSTDLFSKQSDDYARFRPTYPEALFDALFAQVADFDCAWDCATGNGQAAISLAKRFRRVVATDLSEAQIQNAKPHERVEYRCESCEKTSLADQSVSLITIAQAAHWFRFDEFYREVSRVLKPGGVIALFGYHFATSELPEVDLRVEAFAKETLGPYWKPQNRILWNGYREIPFPFEEIEFPKIDLSVEMSLEGLVGYISSWSATQLYREQTGQDPIPPFRDSLQALWGDGRKTLRLNWELVGRIGRFN